MDTQRKEHHSEHTGKSSRLIIAPRHDSETQMLTLQWQLTSALIAAQHLQGIRKGPATLEGTKEWSRLLSEMKSVSEDLEKVGRRAPSIPPHLAGANGLDLADIFLLTKSAAYAAAVYELTRFSTSPFFYTDADQATQPILHYILGKHLCSTHITELQYSNAPGTATFFLMVHDVHKEIVLAFRGTQEFGDVLTDLMYCKGNAEEAVFHAGAEESIRRDYDRIESALLALSEAFPDYKLLIVGHSLGGGLAVTFSLLFLEKLKERNLSCVSDRIQVVTFGAMPSLTAVGVERYADFASRILNVMSPRDPVPNIVTALLYKLGESAPGSPTFSKMFSSSVFSKSSREEDADGSEKAKEEKQIDWDEEYMKRVESIAFYEGSMNALSEAKKRKILGEIAAQFPSDMKSVNPNMPVLFQFGTPISVLKGAPHCLVATAKTFHEVMCAHIALSGFVAEEQDQEEEKKDAPSSWIDWVRRKFQRDHRRLRHHMMTIPELLKNNLEFHSITTYQKSLLVATVYDEILEEAEHMFLRQ